MEQLAVLKKLSALSNTPGIGAISAKKLADQYGGINALFDFDNKKATGLQHDKVENLRQAIGHTYRSQDNHLRAQKEQAFMAAKGVDLTHYGQENYPELLRECPDAPMGLMMRGSWPKNQIFIGVVGTRKPSKYGVEFCRELIKELAPLNPVIVSGLAYGIDVTAHRTALDLGLNTLACLAHGIDRVYPKSHAQLAECIVQNGALLTEFWTQSEFHPSNFLQRNRIIAGLTSATVVIESGAKGGSLITAQFANAYDREVFAVPGHPYQSTNSGCNDLIKNHAAHLLTNAADMIRVMGWSLNQSPAQHSGLNQQQRQLVRVINDQPYIHVDALAKDLKFKLGPLQSELLYLEMGGYVLSQSGCYVLSNRGVRALESSPPLPQPEPSLRQRLKVDRAHQYSE